MKSHNVFFNRFSIPIITLAFLLFPPMIAADVSAEIILAEQGEALQPVVISGDASGDIEETARKLTLYLGEISGADFSVERGDGSSGIAVGTYADFPGLALDDKFDGEDPFRREEYLLRTHENGVYLIGATELATRHAVWDLLHRTGYRQYFPGDTWEVIPETDMLRVDVDSFESPDYLARRIWYNWGMRWGYNQEPYQKWQERNRMARGFELRSGHAYGRIHSSNRETFEENPEFYALVDGEREYLGGDTKFCIGNEGLRKLVVEYAKAQVRENPELDSISMDPSDGGGWCSDECELCAQLGSGSISDRALTLANEVAEAINELELGEKYVGMYAYNEHGPPPTIDVHPNVIMSAATGFLRGGYSLDEIIEGWRERGATLGIYDYFSVVAWDWNQSRRARGGRPLDLAERIPDFYEEGARFFDAESGDAWGPYGLGFYVASRLMWDVGEAERVEEIITEFIDTAFGPASEPMGEFYHLIATDTERRSDEDLLGRMYRLLGEARKLAAGHPDITERVDHLILYTRYYELYHRYANAAGDARESARDELLAHTYRMRETMMVHSYGIWARLIGQGAAHTDDHPLKDDEPFADEELEGMIEEGIERFEPVELDFTAVQYSEELVPAAEALGLEEVETPGVFPPVPQDRQNYYIWVEEAPTELHLKVTVQKRWDLRPHKITLYSPKQVYVEPVDTSDIVRPDGETYDVVLETDYSGLHRIEIQDGGDHTRIEWPEGLRVTLPSTEDTPGVKNHFRGKWSMYFYVPKGTEVVGGWAERIANWAPPVSGVMRDADGNVVHEFDDGGYFTIEVPEGQDGRLWKFENTHGLRQLMTVPPYLAPTASDLLLPAEVIEEDKAT